MPACACLLFLECHQQGRRAVRYHDVCFQECEPQGEARYKTPDELSTTTTLSCNIYYCFRVLGKRAGGIILPLAFYLRALVAPETRRRGRGRGDGIVRYITIKRPPSVSLHRLPLCLARLYSYTPTCADANGVGVALARLARDGPQPQLTCMPW